MKEKEAIERATADGFIRLYNETMAETYRIVEHADAPDIRCRNDQNQELNLEITTTENRTMDLASLLGRSESRSMETLRRQNDEVRSGHAVPQCDSLLGNVSEMLVSRIIAKLRKDMGGNVALVIRDTCPVNWNWEIALDDIRTAIAKHKNPYDRGIWLVNYSKNKLYRIVKAT